MRNFSSFETVPVNHKLLLTFFIVLMPFLSRIWAQDVTLYDQQNGHYDFLMFGNTLNMAENGPGVSCQILTASSAQLNLSANNTIVKAFLYWAGSGTGDFDVRLNGVPITAARTFGLIQPSNMRPYFSAFADVTAQVQTTGSGAYTLSELDLTAIIAPYCPNGGNFGGWAIVVVYENPTLPLNQINIYDGLQGVPTELAITLDNLNVIDNAGSKIGFVAWEGDRSIAVNETLRINGNVVGNPPLNPVDNAFNGTNSFTGSTTLYNMDLDVYDIQSFIAAGDTTAEITLTSGQDFVMINTVVTKLNSRLPDATMAMTAAVSCNARQVSVHYEVFNVNASDDLPSGVPIAFYANGQFIGGSQTQAEIPVGGSQTGAVVLELPDGFPTDFNLTASVDDDGTGSGNVVEIDETNNGAGPVAISLPMSPGISLLPDVFTCNDGLTRGTFDFSAHASLAATGSNDLVTFHETLPDAQTGSNAITDAQNYQAVATSKTIYVRVDTPNCYAVTSFALKVRNCPPTVYNFISGSANGQNDDFFIKGLRDVFLNFKLQVFNRWGQLVWTGNNQSPNWNGRNNEGSIPYGKTTPSGTYFYVLELNDPDYPTPLRGFLYFAN